MKEVFKIGDKIFWARALGEVVSIDENEDFPVFVLFNDGFSVRFTLDAYDDDESIILIERVSK